MSALANFKEPLAIVTVFTIGTLINRRRRSNGSISEKDVETALDTPTLPRLTSKLGSRNLPSAILAQFPFLVEVWYWQLTYWIYQGLRALSARKIAGNDAIFQTAVHHAQQLLTLEKSLGIDVELPLQRLILHHAPWLMTALSRVYFSHIVLGLIFLVYSYTVLPRHTFSAIRRTLALENVLAFLVLTVWRCAPPRLMPHPQYGYRDIVHESSGNTAWTENKFRLVIAAMPSLHFANSLFLGWCLARFSPHAALRVLGPLWPVTMWITVVATANHWVLDTVAGVGVLVVAYRWNRVLLGLLPLEEFVLGVLRLEKPGA
ncbi:PAP2 superfamily-domain-containing protein [Echria macrotheca]|uniref:PAP2 superfamily-domain-containing protein n=1 Tax=Echria macrotheca TaxID=438768 RepID=A0AAJ0B904_9PEZI|nr:PAP2 superfamily-domain-containing protein [Echria macrotheca]